MNRGLKASGAPAGFTIVETLVVLAVTGFLFVAIAAGFVGKQQNAEFRNAIQNVRSQIQQTINDVANGYFPSTSNFRCTSPSANNITISNGSTAQGTNNKCVFLGKVMQFTTTGSPQPYYIHTVAGYRATSYQPMNQLDPTYVTYVKENKELGGGLTFAKMVYSGGTINSVGFLYSLGKADDAGGGFANGSQQVDVYAIKDTNFTGNMASYELVGTGGVEMCFKGANGQWGKVTVGAQQGTSATSLQITKEDNCGI